MLKVAVAGLGGMGLGIARRLLQLPNARLVAVADARPERLTEEAFSSAVDRPAGAERVARYSDAGALIAEADVDVVVVCLPTEMHSRYSVQALEAGRHVLCEKPMALTLEDADWMIEAGHRSRGLLMIAHCVRFWPEYRFLRQCVRDSRFGRLLSLNLHRTSGRPAWAWQSWLLDPGRSGGAVLDMHIHDVDFAQYLLGLPDTIQATRRVLEPGTGLEVIHALYGYRDGPQVHLHSGWGAAEFPFRAGFEAWFERGFVRHDSAHQPLLEVFCEPQRDIDRLAGYAEGDAYTNELTYFLSCVERNVPPDECLPESARESLRLVVKELAAAESGEPLSGGR